MEPRDRFAAILLVLISTLRDYADEVEELCRFVSKETLKITDKPVDISLASSFVDNILVIVIFYNEPRKIITWLPGGFLSRKSLIIYTTI